MTTNTETLTACTSCGNLMDPAEAWYAGRCESCAMRIDPCACQRCRGRGTEYRPAFEGGRLVRRLAVCRDCGGEG